MAFLTQEKFRFASQGLPSDTFGVVRFKGVEGFSRPYEFEINLVATDPEIDLTQVLENTATFTILRPDGDIPFHGILARFEQLQQVEEYVFYRAVLVPKLWWLSLTHHNQVFLDKTVPEIIEGVLKDGGLTDLDFQLRLEKSYPKWEYICQYRESHLDFVSRWMEREGMYCYFEQADGGEKVIITDTNVAHSEMPQGKTMYYSPVSGLDESRREEVIKTLLCSQQMLPRTLRLKDYNYRTPSLDISGRADVSPKGRGEIYLYGEHFRTPEEGDALAKIRVEELLCREKQFHGESTIPYLRPGFLFDLEDHYRGDFNQKYLTVELEHEGSHASLLIAGIQKGLSEVEEEPYYRNTFVAIPGHVQFRAERKTEKARFYGMMNAKIDAAEAGEYAELDDQGRYKVVLPFDLSGRQDGKASTWLRMAQPYVGTDHGMHFPLHKGTEVLLTFIDGDPDRPVISGAVPNPDTPSVITSKIETPQCDIRTSGGNEINFQDEKGHERIVIKSPNQDSLVKLGDHLEDKGWYQRMGFDGIGTVGALLDYKATAIKAAFNLVGLAFGHDMGVEEGVELRSANGLKIGVLKKEQAIGGFTSPGYASTSVTGVAQHSVTGYSEKSVLGLYEESTKGIHSFDVVGEYKESIMGWGQFFAAKKNTIVGAAEKVYGGFTKAAGEVTKLAGKVSKLVGQNTKVVEDEIEMVEMKTEMDGEETHMTGEKTEMTGKKTELDGEKTHLTGEKTEMSGEEIEMVEMRTEMTGERTEMDGEKTEMSGEETKMSSESNQISGMVTIM